jgi:hypothetical protein
VRTCKQAEGLFHLRQTARLSALLLLCLFISVGYAQVSINANSTLDGAAVGAPYNVNLFPAGATPPYNFTLLAGALPSGLTLSPAGILSGTPSTAGSANFTVGVQDSAGASAVKQFTLNVSAAPLALSPAPGALPGATAGQVYSQNFTATGGSGTYTYILLPAQTFINNMDLDPRSGQLLGTPLSPGTMSFGVEVIDSDHRTLTQNYTLNVLPQSTLTFGEPCTTLPATTPGADYPTTQLVATGGVVPYTFLVNSSSLPPSLSVTQDGKLRGIGPLTGLDVIQFPITVTDGAGTSASRVCSIPVNHPSTLTITSSSPLPTGIAGQPYTKTLVVQSALADAEYLNRCAQRNATSRGDIHLRGASRPG